MTGRLLAWVAVAAAASLYGYTTVQPNLSPAESIQETFQATPSLPNAVKVGASMKTRYIEKVESQLVWERLTGLTRIRLSTVGADLTLGRVARSAVVGMGVLARGAYATSN